MGRITLLTALLLILAACGSSGSVAGTTGEQTSSSLGDPAVTTLPGPTTTAEQEMFPVTVSAANGPVVIEARPERIVSLSSTATEMLFAVGAGDQVVAVDEFSIYPSDAPITDLSGFSPNLEAIVGFEPDLVVISFDPGELQSGLDAVGIPSLLLTTALSLDDSYSQLEVLGAATGHLAEAAGVVAEVQAEIDEIVGSTTVPEGISFYHEVDETLYSASSHSFLGQIYALLGMENIADAADPDGIGFPQLASEYVVSQDPDLIILADVDYGVTPESLSARPGWDAMTAVQNGAIVELEAYLASNWGPRVVELLTAIADAVSELEPVS
jgi:iron complex transport system substrate-binding protein